MKGSIVAAAAALVGGAAAARMRNVHAHAHELFEKREEAQCTTYYTTITGAMSKCQVPARRRERDSGSQPLHCHIT